jgi:hypothetical protein
VVRDATGRAEEDIQPFILHGADRRKQENGTIFLQATRYGLGKADATGGT